MAQLAYDKGSRRFDTDGRMHVANCRIGRACVSPYFGREIPNHAALGLEPSRIYRMYRDPGELERAADSFANLPLLIKHVPTTADAPANEFWVGTTGSKITFDNGYLVTDTLSVWTDEAIGHVVSHKQEQLSPSYNYRPDMTPGVTADGQAYDGVMRDIRGNHVALVEQGRQGPSVAVADSHPLGVIPMKPRFPALAAALAAIMPSATAAQLAAFDSALATDMGVDCDLSDTDRKAAEDAWRAGKGMATDAAMSDDEKKAAYDSWKTRVGSRTTIPPTAPAADTRPAITQADLDAAVTRATEAGAKRAREDASALYTAQRAVEPVLGIVTMDSAEAIYEAALKKLNVDIAGLPAAAFKPLFDSVNKTRATPVPRIGSPVPAFDAANRANVRAAIPAFANVNVRG